MRVLLPLAAAALPLFPMAAAAQAGSGAAVAATAPLSDEELSRVTGRFVLPNGVELALSVTSDTVLNGQLILRTVLTVDHSAQVQVFGRDQQSAGTSYAAGVAPGAVANASPSAGIGGVTGVTVELDRKSGLSTITPSFTAVSPAVTVSTSAPVQQSTPAGLVAVPVVPGGPAIATADGVVSLQAVRNGTQVSFAGDQLSVINLVGRAVGTAVVNTGNDRTLDSVTTVAIDARNLAPYQIGAAQMRVDTLAVEATRGMIR